MFNESKIVSRILAGDRAAFALLVQQYEGLVFHIAGRLLPNREDIKDVCQEAFISVYKGLPGFAFQSKLSSWIGRIAWHAAVNHLRKHKRVGICAWPVEGLRDSVIHETPYDAIVKKELNSHINGLIGQLPGQYKTVAMLYHVNQYSYTEIETATGMPGGTVKVYLFRARKLLRKKLEEHGERIF